MPSGEQRPFYASGGTDGANIVLFWPDNLPDDADRLLVDEPIELVERLQQEGKLVWFPCEGDGAYSLRVFLHDEIPEPLRRLCKHEADIPSLIVRGTGYFGGIEYMFKHDDGSIKTDAGLLQPITIPDGVYSARVYTTELSDELFDDWLVSHVGARRKRMWDIHGIVTAMGLLGMLVAAITCAVSWKIGLGAFAVSISMLAGAVVMSRTGWYKRVAQARAEFEEAYPSYVVHLN